VYITTSICKLEVVIGKEEISSNDPAKCESHGASGITIRGDVHIIRRGEGNDGRKNEMGESKNDIANSAVN
jgi:hypothetical protein